MKRKINTSWNAELVSTISAHMGDWADCHNLHPVTGHKSHEKGFQELVMSGIWFEATGYCT
jgi:hypothetical protein